MTSPNTDQGLPRSVVVSWEGQGTLTRPGVKVEDDNLTVSRIQHLSALELSPGTPRVLTEVEGAAENHIDHGYIS